MNTQQAHVVVGATGGAGGALVRELVARGARVRAVSRGRPKAVTPGVEFVQGDATDLARMREVCRGASVVYNCVNPPLAQWDTLFPRVMETLIAAAGANRARLVFADDTWMYGPPSGPLTEEHPQRPAGALGTLRGQLAATLLAAHQRGEVQAVIGRASELYGPQVESLLGANLFRAALSGKRVVWPGSLDSPLNPTFIDDFARGLITLGTHEEALGQVWHIPTPAPITGREFTRLLFAEVGAQRKVVVLNRALVRTLALVWPVARMGAELIYQFDRPYVVESEKYQRAFGGTPTPYQEGIRQTLSWYGQLLSDEATRPQGSWWGEVWRYGRSSHAGDARTPR
jgi:nucleoside-diphosphate-sugar epimerase